MELKQLFNDDDAVSPVIGVILMVAITVILAAVIATFVLGLGEQVSDTAPQSSFTFDYNGTEPTSDIDDFTDTDHTKADGTLTITHAGGATLQADQVGISGSSAASGKLSWGQASSSDPQSEISSGDSVDVFMASDDTISITWTNQQGTSSATLRKYNGPNA